MANHKGAPEKEHKRLSKTLRFTESEWQTITEKAKLRGFSNKRAQYLANLAHEDCKEG